MYRMAHGAAVDIPISSSGERRHRRELMAEDDIIAIGGENQPKMGIGRHGESDNNGLTYERREGRHRSYA